MLLLAISCLLDFVPTPPVSPPPNIPQTIDSQARCLYHLLVGGWDEETADTSDFASRGFQRVLLKGEFVKC